MQWFKNICRLCGHVEEISYNIFNSNDNLEERIKKCLNLEIYKDDSKPKQVCKLCYSKLNDFSDFINICYATNLKFDTVYYTEPWHNDRILYEPVSTKQSVIVSNRQSHDLSSQLYHQSNTDGAMGILSSYTLNRSENILGFSVNYTNIQPDSVQNCFNECDNFNKHNDMAPLDQSGYEQNNKALNSCLVNENDPSDLLNSVENVSNPGDSREDTCGVIKNILVSIEDVRKSLGTDSVLETRLSSNLKTKKSYSCPHCEKLFMRRSNLNAHISVHTKIRPYKCTSCSKAFAVKCHLTQHKKTHLDIFVCQICHKKFDVPSKLARHVQTHSNNKPFMCNFPNCKKKFSDNNNLKQHTLLHSSEKNFCCVICMKQFKTKKNLQAHVKSHVSNNTFQCKFCQKVFKYKHNLKTHVVKHANKTEIKLSL